VVGCAALALSVLSLAAPPSTPAHAATDTLSWVNCAAAVKDWQDITNGDTTAQCTTVTVPLDYANPSGRTLEIAVSRLKANDPAKRRGILLSSPGGPGGSSITYPLDIAKSLLGDVATDHDLIGFDPRGVGYSTRVDCDPGEFPAVPPTATAKEKAKAAAAYETEYNTRCAPQDLAFTRQLTTANVARDMDAIRAALGERKISYFGVSWGTGLGAVYRSLFDANVDRMWLDSVMPPTMDLEAMDSDVDAVNEGYFVRFADWLAKHDAEFHLGASRNAVRETLFALRDRLSKEPRQTSDGQLVYDGDTVTRYITLPELLWGFVATELVILHEGGVPGAAAAPALAASAKAKNNRKAINPRSLFGLGEDFQFFNYLQNRAVLCNDATGGRDFETVWAAKRNRALRYPAAGGESNHALQCQGWPLPAEPWRLQKGKSPLQLSGHTDEDVTPYAWAKSMQAAIGGQLVTVDNGEHGSLSRVPCAAKAVDFFHTGHTTKGKCDR
jgi:pimeloyl-ACP methyl ester carboxylesterase